MKKFITLGFATLLVGCVNPSLEDGFESLSQNLSELEASLTPIVESITSDMEEIEASMVDIQANVDSITDSQTGALATIAEITAGLERVKENLSEAATAGQVAELAAAVEEFGEGVDMLVFIADYDYDGVMNGLDQCPDTPLSEINEVNGVGCSSTQTPTIGG